MSKNLKSNQHSGGHRRPGLLATVVRKLSFIGSAAPARVTSGTFVMADNAILPYREWMPAGEPAVVVLALHGINDSADAWDAPSSLFVKAGIALIAPDQRGFGAASGHGTWPGADIMMSDTVAMIEQIRDRFPKAQLYLAGESMGGAILMVLATRQKPHWVNGYILSAPAVWGRCQMSIGWRILLGLAYKTVPWVRLSAVRLGIKPTDNKAALNNKTTPGFSLPSASIRALKGLTDLMDLALLAAGNSCAPTLFLYGGKDYLVPKRAMAACWRAERDASTDTRVFAFYPGGYHLLQRDHAGAAVTRDIVNWLADSKAPLPSGADARAAEWLNQVPA